MKITISKEGYNPIIISTESDNSNNNLFPSNLYNLLSEYEDRNLKINGTINNRKESIIFRFFNPSKYFKFSNDLNLFATTYDNRYLVYCKSLNKIANLSYDKFRFLKLAHGFKNFDSKDIKNEILWSTNDFIQAIRKQDCSVLLNK